MGTLYRSLACHVDLLEVVHWKLLVPAEQVSTKLVDQPDQSEEIFYWIHRSWFHGPLSKCPGQIFQVVAREHVRHMT